MKLIKIQHDDNRLCFKNANPECFNPPTSCDSRNITYFITFIQFCVQQIEKCSLNQIKYVLCDKYKVQILNAGTIPGNIF